MKWIIGVTAALSATAIALVARAALKAKGNVYVRNRTIYGPGGFRYRLTNSDLLWLARAVWGEAGTQTTGGAAVIWAMAQYHATVMKRDGTRPAFSSLEALLRAYCQPINPMWASLDASGCQRRPSHCTERQLARRRQITNASWDQIPASVRSLVQRFAAGTLSNPVPGATDWGAFDWQARSQTRIVNIRGNRFGVGRDRRIYRG